MSYPIEDWNKQNPPIEPLTEEVLREFLEDLWNTKQEPRSPVIETGWCKASDVIEIESHCAQGIEPPDIFAVFIFNMCTQVQLDLIRKHIALGKEFQLSYQMNQVVSSIYLKP